LNAARYELLPGRQDEFRHGPRPKILKPSNDQRARSVETGCFLRYCLLITTDQCALTRELGRVIDLLQQHVT
jgi:hypothetical protein